MTIPCSEQDRWLLSNYLVDALSSQQKAQLVSRLAEERDLVEELNQLKRIRALLASLPIRPAPRNFTINKAEYPEKHPVRFFPIFRIATAICSFLFVLSLSMKIYTTPGLKYQMVDTSMPAVSQESTAAENFLLAPAPKAAFTPVTAPDAAIGAEEATQLPAGAGALTAPITEAEPRRGGPWSGEMGRPIGASIPWTPIMWSLGTVSILLGAAMLYSYYRERV